MKKYIYIFSAIILLLLLGTVNEPDALSYDPASEYEENSTASDTSPLLPLDEETIVEQGPIPAPVGDKWYDWDNVGTNCGFSEIVGDENYLYATNGNRLIRCDLDGANPVTLVQDNNIEFIDCIDGNIYYTNHTGLYKIKSDGTGKSRLIQKAVAQFLLNNDRIYYLTFEDEHLYMLDKKSGKTKDLGFRCSYFSCFDNDTIFYTVYYVGDPGTDVLYMYDTCTQKSRRLITLSGPETEMVAANGTLYFFDCIGGYTSLVSYDFEKGNTNVLARICNEERMGGYAYSLLKFDRYLVYFSAQETASDLQITMCGYDLITGKVYEFGIVTYNSSGFISTPVVTPNSLYIENFRICFINGGVRSERLKTDIVEFDYDECY